MLSVHHLTATARQERDARAFWCASMGGLAVISLFRAALRRHRAHRHSRTALFAATGHTATLALLFAATGRTGTLALLFDLRQLRDNIGPRVRFAPPPILGPADKRYFQLASWLAPPELRCFCATWTLPRSACQ